MIIKQQANYAKAAVDRCTQCPNSLTRFHSLLQVNCMSGLMQGIVNEGIGAISDTAHMDH